MAEVCRNTVQEGPQRLVAALLVAGVSFVLVLLGARGNEVGAVFFTVVVEVASFGCIKARVADFLSIGTAEPFWGQSEHP